MKLRTFGKGILFLLVLLGVLMGLLFVPAVQKAVLVAVVSSEDREIAVKSVRVGLGGASIRDLEIRQGDTLFRVPSVKAEFGLLSLLGERPEVSSIEVRDFFLRMPGPTEEDDRKEEGRGEPILPEKFTGLLSESFPVALGGLSIHGSVAVPGKGEIRLSLEAENLVPGAEGEFGFSVDPNESADETIPRVSGGGTVSLDERGRPLEISLDATLSSRIAATPGSLQISGAFVRNKTGEQYDIDLSSEELFANGRGRVEGIWDASAGELGVTLSAAGPNLDFLQPFVSQDVPAVSFEVDASLKAIPGEALRDANLTVSATVSREEVPGVEQDIRVATEFTLRSDDDRGIVVTDARGVVSPVNEEAGWLEFTLSKPLPVEAIAGMEIPEGEFGSLRFAVPGPVLSSLVEGWAVGGLTGEWSLVGSGDALRLEPGDPWTVSVGPDSAEARVDFAFAPRVSLLAEGDVRIVTEATLSADGRSLSVNAEAAIPKTDPGEAEVQVGASGDLLAAAPLFPEMDDFPGGRIEADLDVGLGETVAVSGRVGLQRLRVEGLPEAMAELTVGQLEIRPGDELHLDASLSGTWSANGSTTVVEASDLSVRMSDKARPRIESGHLTFDFDPEAFRDTSETASSPGPEVAAAGGGGLPEPETFALLRESLQLPVEIVNFEADGSVLWKDETLGTKLALSNWMAGTEGTFRLEVEHSDASSPPVEVKGLSRIDSKGGLRNVEGSASLPGNWMGDGLPGFFVEFTFTPGFADAPLAFNVLNAEEGVRLLTASVAYDETVNVLLESDLNGIRRTDWGRFLPNLDGGRLRVEGILSGESFEAQVELAAVAPLDSFDSFDLAGNAILTSLSPLKAGMSGQLTDAKDQVSDLNLQIAETATAEYEISARGNRVDVEAFRDFASIWQGESGEEMAAVEESADTEEDPWPFDEGVPELTGSASIRQVVLPESSDLNRIEARWSTAAEAVSLRVSGAWMEDSSFTGEVRLSKDPNGVGGSVRGRVESIPLGSLLRELEPNQTPTAEGTFDVGVDFSGSAMSLRKLPGRMEGVLSVEGREGLIRSLKPEKRVTRLLEVGSLAGILLSGTLNRPGVGALGEVVMLFKEVPFTTLAIELARTGEQRTEIRKLELRGPYLSLDGAGIIEPSELEGIPESPMRIKLLFGAKEQLARPLRILGLLGTEKIAGDYTEWKKPVVLKGTLLSPDPGELWDSVITAVERAATMNPKDLEREDGKQETEQEKKKTSQEEMIEEGVNQLFNVLGL